VFISLLQHQSLQSMRVGIFLCSINIGSLPQINIARNKVADLPLGDLIATRDTDLYILISFKSNLNEQGAILK
jgi:hypothetical protein